MGLLKQKGTGRAECRLCHKKIEKDSTDVVFRAGGGYMASEKHYHLKCILNMKTSGDEL